MNRFIHYQAKPARRRHVLRDARKGIYVVRMTFLTKLAYMKAFWFNMAGTFVSIIIYYFLWQFVFRRTDSVSGFTAAQMTTYVILSRMLSSQFSGGINRELGRWIYDGTIAVELLRPYFLLQTLFAKRVGEFLFFVVLKALPVSLAAFLLLGGEGPSSFMAAAGFFSSVLLSVVIMFFIECIVGLCCFYTMSDWGLAYTKSAVCAVLSGGVVPLFLFPEKMAEALSYMPFAGMVSVPVNLFLGKYTAAEGIRFFGLQVVWVIGMGVIAYLFYCFAIKNVVVQGG